MKMCKDCRFFFLHTGMEEVGCLGDGLCYAIPGRMPRVNETHYECFYFKPAEKTETLPDLIARLAEEAGE